MCCVFGSSLKSASQRPHWLLVDMQIASLPKENGARCRTVVITQGALPTVVASQGKVSFELLNLWASGMFLLFLSKAT